MTKLKLEFEGFEEMIARLNELGGDTKKITEKALKKSHEYITKQAEEGIQSQNLPAKGKYSHKNKPTEHSLYRRGEVEWAGTVASIPVGFDIKNGGLASIFMIYGTPRYMKVQKLWNALNFKNKKASEPVFKIQEDIFHDAIARLL